MIRIVLVASGSGTDANAVMEAYRKGQLLPECEIVGLLSTVEGAGCLEKAGQPNILTETIARKGKSLEGFQSVVSNYFRRVAADLIFLLGCIHPIPMVQGVRIFNIHPCDPAVHGGRHMYGLETHIHVLRQILDQLWREVAQPTDRFFTFPTVHEADGEYDTGRILLQASVEIPTAIIRAAQANPNDLTRAAKMLQEVVLANEHLMLPAAVNLACQRLLVARAQGSD